MEAPSNQASQVIEVNMDVTEGVSVLRDNKICGGAPCDFSDSRTASSDAHDRSASMRKLLISVILCFVFMTVEVVGGIKANSLAIMTDAAHLLSDVAAFAISLFSIWASGWEATPRQSYGFFRIEILGALVSIQLIWLLVGILVYEAIVRIVYESGEVQGSLMFAVSAFGLVVNIVMAVLLGHDHGHGGHSHGHGGHNHSHGGHSHSHGESDHDHSDHEDDHDHGHEHAHDVEHGSCQSTNATGHHHHHSGEDKHKDEHEPLLTHSEDAKANGTKKKKRNINVHSAYLHVLGDCIQSLGVMIGGALIWYNPKWKIIDLLCTLGFSVIVLGTTINLLRNILEVLMESTPREIDATRLEKGLCDIAGVVAVHELHIWAITVGKVLLACHVTITPETDADYALDQVIGYIKREYNISHVTIQIERQ